MQQDGAALARLYVDESRGVNGDPLLLVLDEGTSSTRALLYSADGATVRVKRAGGADAILSAAWLGRT